MPERRLGRLEVLGAWLRVWTPPRGAVVPPVPWRPLAIAAALVAVALLAAAALLVPGILDDREREPRHGRHHGAARRGPDPQPGAQHLEAPEPPVLHLPGR